MGRDKAANTAPLIGAACLIWLAVCVPAHAEEACAPSPLLEFDIPAGSLSAAAMAFSRQTGLQVVLDPRLTPETPAGPYQGQASPCEALRALARSASRAGMDVEGRLTRSGAAFRLRPHAPSEPQADTAPDESHAPVIERIIVRGPYGNSLSRSLQIKRDFGGILDAITAEDLGRFPSQNLAEALQRVPGVSILRDRGEGLYVRIQGLPSEFNQITWHGNPLASNENVRTSEQFGRQYRYDTLPTELISEVRVLKSASAELSEGAIGGVVELSTFRPLDSGSMSVASAQGTRSDPSGETTPRLSAMTSRVSDDGRLGVLAGAVYSERAGRQDRVINFGWEEFSSGLDTDGDGRPDTGPVLSPGDVRPTLELEFRRRLGVLAAAQWRGDGGLEADADLMWTWQDIDYDELTYSGDYDTPDRLLPDSIATRRGAIVAGRTRSGSVQIGRENAGLRDANLNLALSLRGPAGPWIARTSLFHSRAESHTADPIRRARLRQLRAFDIDYRFPRSDGRAVPDLAYGDLDLQDPSALPGRRLEWRTIRSVDHESLVSFGGERPVPSDWLVALDAGVQLRQRSRDYLRRDLLLTEGIDGETFGPDWFGAFPVEDFLRHAQGDLPRVWAAPDMAAFFTGWPDDAARAAPPTPDDLRNSYRVEETIASAHVLGRLDFDLLGAPARGDAGARLAWTRQRSAGHAVDGTDALPIAHERDYVDVLPSANLVWEPDPGVRFRLAAGRAITRPNLQDLAPRLTLNSGDPLTAVGGNPLLGRYQAWQYNVSVERDLPLGGLISALAFYKDIGTFVQLQRTAIDIGGVEYELDTRVNGADAKAWGIELAVSHILTDIPMIEGDLGFQANYTRTETDALYVDGDSRIRDRLADVARNTANLSIFYERGGFGIRTSYSWRGDLVNAVGTESQAAENAAAFGSLDGVMSWDAAAGATLFFEGQNLLNAAEHTFAGERHFQSYTHFGRTLTAGLRLRY
ncbi:TonB-dependent receptor [Glycocaulis profundi]|nr:TonB-dependent receptor [Glycocaulis profundi]